MQAVIDPWRLCRLAEDDLIARDAFSSMGKAALLETVIEQRRLLVRWLELDRNRDDAASLIADTTEAVNVQ